MVVLMGGAADGIRHAHRRHAAGQRAESRRFRHQCHVLLLCRHDGRLHHGALHQTGEHTQRRSRTYHGLPDRLFLQPTSSNRLPALFGAPVVLAWPWWCPIGVAVSLLVCLCGKSKPKINTQTI